MASQELIGYAAAIIRERGIAQSELTPAILGEVLCEAVRRMDAMVGEMTEGRTDRSREAIAMMGRQIYWACRLDQAGIAA